MFYQRVTCSVLTCAALCFVPMVSALYASKENRASHTGWPGLPPHHALVKNVLQELRSDAWIRQASEQPYLPFADYLKREWGFNDMGALRSLMQQADLEGRLSGAITRAHRDLSASDLEPLASIDAYAILQSLIPHLARTIVADHDLSALSNDKILELTNQISGALDYALRPFFDPRTLIATRVSVYSYQAHDIASLRQNLEADNAGGL